MAVVAGVLALQGARPSELGTQPVAAEPVAVPVGDPLRLVVDKIGVDAGFEPLAIGGDGRLEAPVSTDDVGWSIEGPEPGEAGTAVVAGHYDSRTGPGVFYRLEEMAPGDEVIVGGQLGLVTFVVDRVETYSKEAVPDEVHAPTTGASLRLITCGGEFDHATRHYQDNVVVWATLRS